MLSLLLPPVTHGLIYPRKFFRSQCFAEEIQLHHVVLFQLEKDRAGSTVFFTGSEQLCSMTSSKKNYCLFCILIRPTSCRCMRSPRA